MKENFAYDIFISHAFEDKSAFANELAVELMKTGLKVWYSGFELRLGDSIALSINEGLKSASFGIVIISPVYLTKRWAMNELATLIAQEGRQNKILPVLHEITIAELREQFPILADRYTVSSSLPMETIVKKVLETIATSRKHPVAGLSRTVNTPEAKKKSGDMDRKQNASATIKNANSVTVNNGSGWVIVLLLLLAAAIGFYYFSNSSSGSPAIDKSHSMPSNSN